MIRIIWVSVLAVLLVLPALAAPDAASSHKKRLRSMREREDDYWDAFPRRLSTIYQEWTQMRRLWRGDPEGSRDKVLPLEAMQDLYAEYVEIQGGYGEADKSLALSGHEKAPGILLDELFDLGKDIESLEKTMAEARPVGGGTRYEQELFVKRHGLAHREVLLVEALSRLPDAAAFLTTEAWRQAEKGDRGRRTWRRTAVLDALGKAASDEARVFLEGQLASGAPFVRLVAIENLVPYGAPAAAAVTPHFLDVSRAVRRALCDAIRTRAPKAAPWVEPLLDGYAGSRGVERARALAALRAITGQDLGDAPEAWRAWFSTVEAAVRDGTFETPPPPATEDGEAGDGDAEEEADPPPLLPDPPVPAVTTFYGVGSPSRRLVFCVSGTSDMGLPADLAVQTRRSRQWWQANRQKWEDEFLDHATLLEEQLASALGQLPESARFAAVHLFGATPSRIGVFGDRKPIAPTKAGIQKVLKAIRKVRPGGTLSCEEALRRVFPLWDTAHGQDPGTDDVQLDTVFLVDSGWVGGRWEIPEAFLAAVERANRFPRLVIHSIRICDRKADAEALMRGLAEVTGGTYLWVETPPER